MMPRTRGKSWVRRLNRAGLIRLPVCAGKLYLHAARMPDAEACQNHYTLCVCAHRSASVQA